MGVRVPPPVPLYRGLCPLIHPRGLFSFPYLPPSSSNTRPGRAPDGAIASLQVLRFNVGTVPGISLSHVFFTFSFVNTLGEGTRRQKPPFACPDGPFCPPRLAKCQSPIPILFTCACIGPVAEPIQAKIPPKCPYRSRSWTCTSTFLILVRESRHSDYWQFL